MKPDTNPQAETEQTKPKRTPKVDRHGMIYYDIPSNDQIHEDLAFMAERLKNPPKPKPGQTQHQADMTL